MYKLIGTNSVKRLADGACIPFTDGNIDYEEYKLWIAEGNTPEPEFTEDELALQEQARFRAERDKLLAEADIVIYKLEDTAQDATAWRAYRQALRDATLTWVIPEKPL